MTQRLRLYRITKAEGVPPSGSEIIDLDDGSVAARLREELLAGRYQEIRAIPASAEAGKAFWALLKQCGLHRVAVREPPPRLYCDSDKVYGRKTATVFLDQQPRPDLWVNFHAIAWCRPLIEPEWLDCPDAEALDRAVVYGIQHVVESPQYPRKQRLFACTCCRRIWKSLSPAGQNAVAVSEHFADDRASQEELNCAQAPVLAEVRQAQSAFPLPTREGSTNQSPALDEYLESFLLPSSRYLHEPYNGQEHRCFGHSVPELRVLLATLLRGRAPLHATGPIWASIGPCVKRAALDAARVGAGRPGTNLAAWSAAVACEEHAQAVLFRDIFGNPFRPVTIAPALLTWHDATIPKLAQAAYDERELPSGHLDAKRLAILADALEEAGCTNEDVLTHLRGAGPHVRGCWVVDLLLGKE